MARMTEQEAISIMVATGWTVARATEAAASGFRPSRGTVCPDCGGPMPKSCVAKGYHCDRCTAVAEGGAS